jgi:hypothetical protein
MKRKSGNVNTSEGKIPSVLSSGFAGSRNLGDDSLDLVVRILSLQKLLTGAQSKRGRQ